MCGRINVSDDPLTKVLSQTLGLSSKKRLAKGQNNQALVAQTQLKYSRDIAPGGLLSFIRGEETNREVREAIWWLLLEDQRLKPNYRYASFNSRSDQLYQPRSIAYHPYRTSRCIIPASGFVEGLGDKRTYFHIRPEHSAIAFGGLYKEWINKETGEYVYSASIITLGPHKRLANIHPKSMPLMLPWQDQDLINKWLDPDFSRIDDFRQLLVPQIRERLIVTPIDKPSTRNETGDTFVLEKDAA